jgi:hypothetical protein
MIDVGARRAVPLQNRQRLILDDLDKVVGKMRKFTYFL